MVGGVHGLIGQCVLHCHGVLVVPRGSNNVFVTILHPRGVEKIVLVAILRKKIVMWQILQVRY